MSKFIINGGKQLKGEIEVMGFKNNAAAIIPATLLVKGPCKITNVPQTTDVQGLIDIIEGMGAKVERGDKEVTIDSTNIDVTKMDRVKVSRMRMSILLMGSLVTRFNSFSIAEPGGCKIGARPVGTHLDVLRALGVSVEREGKDFKLERQGDLKGNLIVLDEFSVTATENALLAACLADGKTDIYTAAAEPHVCDLANYLVEMGAKISGIGTHHLVIEGVKELTPKDHKLLYDYTEMGTFVCLAAATKSDIKIKNFDASLLRLEMEYYKRAGINIELHEDYAHVKPSASLKAIKKVQTQPYPGLGTDLLAPFATLLTQAEGTTLVFDTMFEGRVANYIPEFAKMGANVTLCDPHRAVIMGPTPLYGDKITSFDLRAGAALIIAALLAQGKTEIQGAEQVERGYEKIDERLRALGADITKEE